MSQLLTIDLERMGAKAPALLEECEKRLGWTNIDEVQVDYDYLASKLTGTMMLSQILDFVGKKREPEPPPPPPPPKPKPAARSTAAERGAVFAKYVSEGLDTGADGSDIRKNTTFAIRQYGWQTWGYEDLNEYSVSDLTQTLETLKSRGVLYWRKPAAAPPPPPAPPPPAPPAEPPEVLGLLSDGTRRLPLSYAGNHSPSSKIGRILASPSTTSLQLKDLLRRAAAAEKAKKKKS